MKVEIHCYTVKELAEEQRIPLEEILECYGADAVKLFFAEAEGEDCPFAGVLCADGSCNVYGLNMDEEYVTFGRMTERLIGYFVKEI